VETWLADALKAEGLRINEVAGWRRNTRPGDFNPVGVMNHHTAGHNDLLTVIRGRPGLNGPLANFYVARDGLVTVIAAGRCNHAGAGSGKVLERTRRSLAPQGDATAFGLADDTTGNGHYFGIEVENLGDGRDPYPDVQIDALVKVNAAICRHEKWSATRVIHHREWTKRKVDMSFRGDLRGKVARYLAGGEEGLSMADAASLEKHLDVIQQKVETTYNQVNEKTGTLANDLRAVKIALEQPSRITLSPEALDFLAKLIAERVEIRGLEGTFEVRIRPPVAAGEVG